MSNNFKSIFHMFKDKMKVKNPVEEWIEHERNLNKDSWRRFMQSAQFASVIQPGVKQTLEVKPAVLKLTPLEGVLKNSQGLNNKDLMQKQMKITRNMKESKPVVPVNNRQGNIHHEEKAKTADPKVVQRYKPLNNQIITLDL